MAEKDNSALMRSVTAMPYVIRHPKLRYFGMALINAWSSWVNLNGYGVILPQIG